MNIIAYLKTGCPWCEGVKNFFDERNIQYEERNVTQNPEYFKEMVDKSGQDKAPTLSVEGEIIADTDREQVEKFLKERGYIK